VVLEASTNLFQWSPIHTNLISDFAVFLFRDLESGAYPRRFYRARLHVGPLPQPSIRTDTAGIQNGQFGFNLDGIPGQKVVVEASTNLLNWMPLVTNTLGTKSFIFSEPGPTNFSWRFYRARLH